jgi:peptide chain release factor 1
MFSKLENLKKEYEKLQKELASPLVLKNPQLLKKYSKKRAEIEEVITKYNEYRKLIKDKNELKKILDDKDEELKKLASEDLMETEERIKKIEKELKILLLPKDEYAGRDIILEVRAGTGGEEACLFAGELLRMYLKYAEKKQWKTEILNENSTGLGGYKEVIIGISGKDAYQSLKYESGIHRVQRVPQTESSGRIHTSAASVAVLPEAEEVEVDIKEDDLKIDTFRASGAGGQHVNKTSSAVRITHIPTGTVVSCQDERSQHQNKAKALRLLRAHLLEKRKKEQKELISKTRKTMIGSGDRSEKIRTYNFPQDRVTDHRIPLTIHNLQDVLSGDIDSFVESLLSKEQEES